jgi:hypothetical protein
LTIAVEQHLHMLSEKRFGSTELLIDHEF